MEVGLPALAFTEHLDLTGWVIDPEDLLDHVRPLVDDNGLLIPEPLDVAGYLESVERGRRQFPELRILSGVEFGQPHIDDRPPAIRQVSLRRRLMPLRGRLAAQFLPGAVIRLTITIAE